MHQVIARTYRPQRFSEVIGQRHVTQTLQNALRLRRAGHGYIFSGQRGVGKTTMARLLAKALNCHRGWQPGDAPEPCGECPSCIEIAAGRSVDVIEIDAASNRGIDAVRELRENARYAPARDQHKIFIIDEAHQITSEGFNALLKTLEEPPPHVIFILATTELHDLPETILSRCQHFAFHAGNFAEILGHLEKICAAEKVAADAEALAAIAASAGGSLRDALSRLEQAIAAFGQTLKGDAVLRLLGAVPAQMVEEVFAAVKAQSRDQLLGIIARLVEEGYQLQHFSSQLVRAVRNMLVAKLAGSEPHLLETSAEECQRLAQLAAEFSEQDLMRFLDLLLALHQQLRYAVEPRFAMELGLLKLVEAERLVLLEELIARLDAGAPARPIPDRGGASAGALGAGSTGGSSGRASRFPATSPFEQDTLRKRQTFAGASPPPAELSAIHPEQGAAETAAERQAASAARVPVAAAAPEGWPQDWPQNWRDEVLRQLEEQKKMMLSSLLTDAVWEPDGSDVCIRPASAGLVSIVPETDRKLLEQIIERVLGQKVRVNIQAKQESAPDQNGGAASARKPPASRLPRSESKSAGGEDAETEARVRQDPEIQQFESIFGKPVTGIRKWRE